MSAETVLVPEKRRGDRLLFFGKRIHQLTEEKKRLRQLPDSAEKWWLLREAEYQRQSAAYGRETEFLLRQSPEDLRSYLSGIINLRPRSVQRDRAIGAS
jgi:hypothetical protein